MSKLLSVFLALSCLAYANTTQDKIADTKAQIQKLQDDLKHLEAMEGNRPENIAARREEANTLKTHAEFGFVSTSGNTDTTAYSLDLDMKKQWDKHVFTFMFDGQYADDKNIETINKFLTELSYDYEFTDRFAFTYLLGYKDDKFSGYNYQAYTGPGARYKLIKEESHRLSIEGSLLYAQDELENTSSAIEYASLRTKAIYEWQILENLKFTQDLSYRTELDDSKNYFVYSKSAFISKISDIFSFGINYKLDYVNTPPLGTQNSDKTLTANLIIDY
ncbi:MAG: DUF481 domain-containing protein [Sulfurimonas sp.]|nr:DUF481 domain-containing protein [Sulfurimonas sp.]MDQ7060638.1 DUF481 domain-containing protein [Sulfurimonas sp.]